MSHQMEKLHGLKQYLFFKKFLCVKLEMLEDEVIKILKWSTQSNIRDQVLYYQPAI